MKFNSLVFFFLKKISVVPLVHKPFQNCNKEITGFFYFEKLEGLFLTFVGKYKYSGLHGVSDSGRGKSVQTVYTTAAHSPLSVLTFINVENQEPYLPI